MAAVSDSLRVRQLASGELGNYEKIVAADPAARLSQTPHINAFLQNTVGGEPIVLVAEKSSGETAGALPLFRRDDAKYGRIYNSLPWQARYGGCVGVTEPEARLALLARFAELARAKNVFSASLVVPPAENRHIDTYVAAIMPDARDDRVTQITEFPDAGADLEQTLEMSFLPSCRRQVRKIRRGDLVETVTDDEWAWEYFYKTRLDNVADLGGQEKPWEHFLNLRNHVPPQYRRLSVATLDGHPVAALLVFTFNRTMEYFIPAYTKEHRAIQPTTFLVWHAMLDGIRRGFRRWDWGHSWLTQETLRKFKAGWGGTDQNFTILTIAGDETRKLLLSDKAGPAAAFPNYYLFPFNSLQPQPTEL